MTPWVLALNEVTPDLARVLPPTDTRLRADIRALELGQYDQVPCTSSVAVHFCLLSIHAQLGRTQASKCCPLRMHDCTPVTKQHCILPVTVTSTVSCPSTVSCQQCHSIELCKCDGC